MDIKLDDKGGGFEIADTRDNISRALNNLENQANINEVRYDVDKEEVIKEDETEIATIVDQILVMLIG